MAKSVLQELAEADEMHRLASKMRLQKDAVSAAALDAKVQVKRTKAIKRMGKRVKKRKAGPI